MALRRLNGSLLEPVEKPAMMWLVARFPAWIVPDHMTLLSLSGAALAACGYLASRASLLWLWLASAGLVLNWLGDSTDGNLARHRRIERPRYGFFVDHTSDLFSNVMIFLSLGLSPCTHFAVACIGLIVFQMGFVFTLIGAQAHASMRIAYFGFGPTEIRVLLLFGNFVAIARGSMNMQLPFWPFNRFDPLSTFDLGILLLAAAGVLLIGGMAIRECRSLGVQDPPRPAG
jgi:archaetidylinositol phosphate synthase